MKKREHIYIPYENFGLGVAVNLVLSFIKMYGSTYASSQHIADQTQLSRKTVTRSIKYLNDNNYIEIENPNSRSRVIRVTMTPIRVAMTQTRDTVTHKRDDTTHYTKVITKNNKINNKASNKGIEPSSLLNELIKTIENETI